MHDIILGIFLFFPARKASSQKSQRQSVGLYCRSSVGLLSVRVSVICCASLQRAFPGRCLQKEMRRWNLGSVSMVLFPAAEGSRAKENTAQCRGKRLLHSTFPAQPCFSAALNVAIGLGRPVPQAEEIWMV